MLFLDDNTKKWSGFYRIGRRIPKGDNVFLEGSDDEICEFIEKHPDYCNNKYNFPKDPILQDVYPFIVICRRAAANAVDDHNNEDENHLPSSSLSISTIQKVYECYPDAILYALHHVCSISSFSSIEILEFLIEKSPDGARSMIKGWLPLHIAVASNASYDVIEYLIKCYPSSVQERGGGTKRTGDSSNPKNLVAGVGSGSDHNSTSFNSSSRSISSSSSSNIYGTKDVVDAASSSGNLIKYKLPLHIAIEYNVSMDIIKLLISKYPKALQEADYEVTEELYFPENGEEIEKVTESGVFVQLPQHRDDDSNTTNNNEDDNTAINKINSDGDAAAAAAAADDDDDDIDDDAGYAEKSVDIASSGWILQKGKLSLDFWTGGLPLHIACSCINEKENKKYNDETIDDDSLRLQYIKYLVEQYPMGLRTKNRAGWLPIHFACKYGLSLNIIQFLISSCPDTLFEKTLFDSNYPVELACLRKNPNVNVIQYLLSQHPITEHPVKNQKILMKYLDSAEADLASNKVTGFLRSVVHNAINGYSTISTNDEH